MSQAPRPDTLIESATPQEQLDSVHTWLLQQAADHPSREEDGRRKLWLIRNSLLAGLLALVGLYVGGVIYALVKSHDSDCAADLWRFTLAHLLVTCTAPVTYTLLTLGLSYLIRRKEWVTPLVFGVFIGTTVTFMALSIVYAYRFPADCPRPWLLRAAYAHVAIDATAAIFAMGLVGGAIGMSWL